MGMRRERQIMFDRGDSFLYPPDGQFRVALFLDMPDRVSYVGARTLPMLDGKEPDEIVASWRDKAIWVFHRLSEFTWVDADYSGWVGRLQNIAQKCGRMPPADMSRMVITGRRRRGG